MTKEDLIYEILDLWEDHEKVLVSPARMDFYLRNLDKVLELNMEERHACILKKRYFEGCTIKKSGQSIVKVKGYVKTPCEGVTAARAGQLIYKAVRMLKHPSRRRMLKGLKTL